MSHYDAIIVGAGAAGLFCAANIKSDKKVLILEKNKKVGLKIQISGGGRCNFTNLSVSHKDFISKNLHFSKSALSQYNSSEFIDLVEKNEIDFYEKKLGQLFCKKNSLEIINMLLKLCKKNSHHIKTEVEVRSCTYKEKFFEIKTDKDSYTALNIVIASGGLSFPKLGVSDIGYRIASKFGMDLEENYPSLVPFLYSGYKGLSGISLPVDIKVNKKKISDDLLFTHRGFSGPAVLKISLYWNPGDEIFVDFLPEFNLEEHLHKLKKTKQNSKVKKALIEYLPERLVQHWFKDLDKTFQETSFKEIIRICEKLKNWSFIPEGTEGYKKAEVTKGGVSTKDLNSKSMESKKMEGLYFIGEVVDVTGLLGGYNFQWAWSSAYSCAKDINNG